MPTEEEEHVLTPGGMRPKSVVHHVKPGEMVMGPGTVVESSDEHVLTPGGYRHKSLVHHIEPGHFLDLASGNVRKMDMSGREVADFGPLPIRPGGEPLMPHNVAGHPRRQPALGSGWISY